MYLQDKNERPGLERYVPLENAAGTDLAEAAELLYRLLDGSFRCSGNCLEREINGARTDVQNAYWRCKETLDRVGNDPERTGFLAMSALEQAWSTARPLILCRLADLLDDGTGPLDDARRLQRILWENPYKKIWAAKHRTYEAILEKIGFDVSKADFSDLTAIMDPLLDALSFYNRKPEIRRIRSGEPSDSDKYPAVAKALCRYRSEKELVDAAMSSGHGKFIAFGAVEKTHAQVKDYFFEWANGIPDERQRNMQRNQGLSEEEYLAMGADYTRQVYLCARDGGNCYLIAMPWRGDQYSRIGEKESRYSYGRRTSYAPYEIFWQEPPPAPPGSTMLAVPRTGYLLSELMDGMSMAWFPAFIDETIRNVFRPGGPDGCRDAVLPEEAVARTPEQASGESAENAYAIVPVCSGVPAVPSYVYDIPAPEDVFEEDFMKKLAVRFGLKASDLAGVPVLPAAMAEPAAYGKAIRANVRKAYARILAGRLAEFMAGRWDARLWMIKRIRAHRDEIIKKAGNGDLMGFMTVCVEGTPLFDASGKPKMVRQKKPPWDEVQDTERIDPDDARERGDPRIHMGHLVLWASEKTAGKPAAVWKLVPETPEDYMALACVDSIDELPEPMRISDLVKSFYDAWGHWLPGDLTNRYACYTDGPSTRNNASIYPHCLSRLNICMTKKVHKSFPYFRNNDKKKP